MPKTNKKIYFASDVHLGASALSNNKDRERLFVAWLNKISKDVGTLYLLGDIFDYWFEYKKVVPRGFVRTLGKLTEMTDAGINIHYLAGNHDMWSFGYLEKEVGLIFHKDELIVEHFGKKFFLHHGDGLGNFDKTYNRLKKIFRNNFLRWWFMRLHPNFALWLAHKWSSKSRKMNGATKYMGDDKEFQVIYAKDMLADKNYDYIVLGHRHLAFDVQINKKTRLINVGDWINHFTYAVFDGKKLEIKSFQP